MSIKQFFGLTGKNFFILISFPRSHYIFSFLRLLVSNILLLKNIHDFNFYKKVQVLQKSALHHIRYIAAVQLKEDPPKPDIPRGW